MYSDEDLNRAIKKGIFSYSAVEEFRNQISPTPPITDEQEHFKLVGGFNDIFIVIACGLLLFSTFSILKSINISLGYLVFLLLSWGLAEFFVLKRKMALPAIMLLIAFVGSTIGLSDSLLPISTEAGAMLAAILSATSAYIHWQRFRVPITVAVASVALIGLIISLLRVVFPDIDSWSSPLLLLCGLFTFAFAMSWDASDTSRKNYRSDVGFWLHLLAAPLIIHPIFTGLNILNGEESNFSMAVVVLLYLLLTTISICIDRRVLMVSSLIYFITALSGLLESYDMMGSSSAFTGIFVGVMLLLMSGYWQRIRIILVNQLPIFVRACLPEVKVV